MESNIKIIQTLHNKVLLCIVYATWYICNEDIQRDLNVNEIKNEIKRFADKHQKRLKPFEIV